MGLQRHYYRCCGCPQARSVAAALSRFFSLERKSTTRRLQATLTPTATTTRTTTTTTREAAADNHHVQKTMVMTTTVVESIHILGAGSMGLLLAASIRAAFPSYPIGVLLRPSSSQYATKSSSSSSSFQKEKKKKGGGGRLLQVCLEQQEQQQQHDGRKRRMMRIIPVPSQIIHHSNNNNNNNHHSSSSSSSTMIRNLVVTTKAFQAVHAIQSIRHRLKFQKDTNNNNNNNNNSTCNTTTTRDTTTSRIIILCNGAMAVHDELLFSIPELQPSDIHLAITTHGAYRQVSQTHDDNNNNNNNNDNNNNKNKSQEDGNDDNTENDDDNDNNNNNNLVHLIHAGIGHMDIPTSLPDFWQPLLNRAHLNVRVQTRAAMQRQLWCKLAANCFINPLTALYQCTNGQLLLLDQQQQQQQRIPTNAPEIMVGIVKEVAAVARAVQAAAAATNKRNHEHHDDDDDHDNDWSVDNVDNIETLFETYCRKVIHDTKNNKSSMLQDVLAQRKTEVDYLNGHVVAMGQRHGIHCPVNADLCRQIQDLTAHFT